MKKGTEQILDKNQIYMGKANEIAGGAPKVYRREKAQGGSQRSIMSIL